MATKAWKEFKARYTVDPLYWGDRGEIFCTAHKVPGVKKMAASEAWNYNRKCDVCFPPFGGK